MAERKVLVTGGAGYVGSHAAKALAAAGYLPVVYDDLSVGNEWAVRWGPLERGSILDADRLRQVMEAHAPVAVMNFAALTLVGESVREPGRYYRANVMGALNVIEAARAAGVGAFVFSSTCAIYGQPEVVPISESAPKAPLNAYGSSKLMVETILSDIDAAHGFPHAALRYFNAAGADPDAEIGEFREVETHLIPLVLDAITGRRKPITVFGTDYPSPDGTAVRDYIHVGDLAAAHVTAMERLLGGTPSFAVNLGTGQGYSVREVLDMAEQVTGRAVPHSTGPRRAGDAEALVADAAAARALLGGNLTPRSDLRTIVETAWAWQGSETYGRIFRG